MNYLLDTCVLSEFTKRQPQENVIRWVSEIEEEKLFLSVLTLGELQRGIERVPDARRRSELLVWLNDQMLPRFHGRLIPIEAQTMLVWGSLTARLESIGRPASVMDSLIAATALCNNLIIVTRNESDFLPSGVQVINPWL